MGTTHSLHSLIHGYHRSHSFSTTSNALQLNTFRILIPTPPNQTSRCVPSPSLLASPPLPLPLPRLTRLTLLPRPLPPPLLSTPPTLLRHPRPPAPCPPTRPLPPPLLSTRLTPLRPPPLPWRLPSPPTPPPRLSTPPATSALSPPPSPTVSPPTPSPPAPPSASVPAAEHTAPAYTPVSPIYPSSNGTVPHVPAGTAAPTGTGAMPSASKPAEFTGAAGKVSVGFFAIAGALAAFL